MAAQIQHAKDLQGLTIYRDAKGRAIYSDLITGKKGYIITDSTMMAYTRYTLRLPVALCAFVLLYFLVNLNLVVSIAIPIVFYVVVSVLFYVKFLPELTETTNFEKKRKSFVQSIVDTKTGSSVAISIFVSILLVVFSILNGLKYNNAFRYLNYAIAAAAFLYAILMVVVLLKKKKENKM